jgi:ATP-dependent DNA ligase
MANLKFIEPMYARAVEKLPEGREWLYEVKLDGYRCLAGRSNARSASERLRHLISSKPMD